jgi:hypothetical protein
MNLCGVPVCVVGQYEQLRGMIDFGINVVASLQDIRRDCFQQPKRFLDRPKELILNQ